MKQEDAKYYTEKMKGIVEAQNTKGWIVKSEIVDTGKAFIYILTTETAILKYTKAFDFMLHKICSAELFNNIDSANKVCSLTDNCKDSVIFEVSYEG